MNEGFWNGKRVLVTGHTGFKGSWLSLWLQKLGVELAGLALDPPTTPSLFDLADVAGGMRSVVGDVRVLPTVQGAVSDHRPEIVIHLAAQSLVPRSFEDPVATFTTNVIGTMNVLEAVRTSGHVRVAIIITSDKCYENREWAWGYRENDTLGGHDPYAASKASAELVVKAYRESFFAASRSDRSTGVASARAGNVIGGGDWAENRLVPDIARALLEDRTVRIRNPRAIRPWQHVLEPLSGYLLLAERLWDDPGLAESWNFGPDADDAQQVDWIVDYMTRAWGGKASWELDGGEHPPEDHFLKLDCSKAKSRLGWSTRLPLDVALDWILEWYRGYGHKADLRALTLAQIDRFTGISRT